MKPWYASKTLWANLIALVATLSTTAGLDLGLTPEAQAQILAGVMAVVNIVLRLVTHKAIAPSSKTGAGLSVLLLAVLLVGCTNPLPAIESADDPFAGLAEFTIADLEAADALAVDQGDEIAHACYPALIRFVKSVAPMRKETRTVKGAFSAFQRVRNARLRLGDGIPVYLRIGCSALLSDSRAAVLRLIARGPAALVPIP